MRLGESRIQRVEQHAGGHAADGELPGPVEESPAVEIPVDVLIEQVEQFLIENTRGLHFHVRLLREGRIPRHVPFANPG